MASDLLQLWNEAVEGLFPIAREQWLAATSGDPYFRPEDGLIALEDGRPAGFLLTKRYRGPDPGCRRFLDTAWISLFAVVKAKQRRGLGRMLLHTAIRRQTEAGARVLQVGGDFFHFAPGVPANLSTFLSICRQAGFVDSGDCWDVSRDLGDYAAPPEYQERLHAAGARVAPFQPGQEQALLDLLGGNDFAPRWRHDAALFLAAGGDIARFEGLWQGDQPLGFAWIHPPGSDGTHRWRGYRPQITAFGPIGVASSERGRGLGLALRAGALERLRDMGAGPTVIDWTNLLDFYGRLGFQPWIRYIKLRKELQAPK